MSYLAKNYSRKKISFKYGKGSYLFSFNLVLWWVAYYLYKIGYKIKT